MARTALPSGTPVELEMPPEGEPRRAVVLAPDVMGLRPLFDDMCAQLAADHAWAMCAVEPFPNDTRDLQQRLAGALELERQLGDLQAAADLVQERTGVGRVAVLGFCMGGMNVMRVAGTGRFDKAVPFYGMVRPPGPWGEPGNDPLDALARTECCPVLAIFGGGDIWTPAADIEAAENAGPHVTAHVYDGAEHGFVHDPSRPAHRADAAADAWRRVVEFLA